MRIVSRVHLLRKMGNKVGKSSAKTCTHSELYDLSEKLLDACRKGQEERIVQLLEKGARVNGYKRGIPLLAATCFGPLQSAKVLIEAGADVNICVRDSIPLFSAGAFNKPEHLDLLLKSGADVNKRDSHKKTALMNLIRFDDRDECMDLLINAGADVNEPLIYAAELGKTNYVKKLLNAGADINHLDQYGITALTCAVQYGQRGVCERPEFLQCTECAKFLIEAGADVNACGTSGITAMYYVVDTGDEALLRALIKAGKGRYFVSKKLPGGDTVLMKAADKGNNRFVDLLIEAGADVNDVNSSGSTALMLAAAMNHHECVKSLTKAGADVNKVDDSGNTALIEAASSCSITPVRLLLHARAKINIFNILNENALKRHMDSGQSQWTRSVDREIVRLLIAAGETLEGPTSATSAVLNTRNQLFDLGDYLEQQHTLKAAIRKHLLELDPKRSDYS